MPPVVINPEHPFTMPSDLPLPGYLILVLQPVDYIPGHPMPVADMLGYDDYRHFSDRIESFLLAQHPSFMALRHEPGTRLYHIMRPN